MTSILSRDNKTAAHVAPLFVFLAFMLLPSVVAWKHPAAPWWRAAPEQWVYPLQTLVALGLLAFWWRQYRFGPLTWRGLAFGALMGTIGIAIWIFPSWWHDRTGFQFPWLGFVSRSGPGFNPEVFAGNPVAYWASVAMRFVRSVGTVPFVEELFWTAFLWPTLADANTEWWRQPFAPRSWRAYALLCLGCMLIHQPADWAAAFIWRAIVIVVALRTRSLGACVLCHAVANLLLGLYIMAYRQWGFW